MKYVFAKILTIDTGAGSAKCIAYAASTHTIPRTPYVMDSVHCASSVRHICREAADKNPFKTPMRCENKRHSIHSGRIIFHFAAFALASLRRRPFAVPPSTKPAFSGPWRSAYGVARTHCVHLCNTKAPLAHPHKLCAIDCRLRAERTQCAACIVHLSCGTTSTGRKKLSESCTAFSC